MICLSPNFKKIHLQLLQLSVHKQTDKQKTRTSQTLPPPIANLRRTQKILLPAYCSLWSPYVIGQTIIFLPCDFYLLLLILFSSPNLSGQRLDVGHTSTHCVALKQWARAKLGGIEHTAPFIFSTATITLGIG